jgi:4-hydroxymandelate oxidase
MANLEIHETEEESSLFACFTNQLDPALTCQDIEWLQSLTSLPIVFKGI